MGTGAPQPGVSLVGRAEELDALELFASPASPVRVCVLVGAAGAGKTVLWKAGVEV